MHAVPKIVALLIAVDFFWWVWVDQCTILFLHNVLYACSHFYEKKICSRLYSPKLSYLTFFKYKNLCLPSQIRVSLYMFDCTYATMLWPLSGIEAVPISLDFVRMSVCPCLRFLRNEFWNHLSCTSIFHHLDAKVHLKSGNLVNIKIYLLFYLNTILHYDYVFRRLLHQVCGFIILS